MRTSSVALFCNVEVESVMQSVDADTIYRVPLNMQEEKLDEVVLRKTGFNLQNVPQADMKEWNQFLNMLDNATEEVRITLVGKYVQLQDAYKSIREALTHASVYNNRKLKLSTVLSDSLNEQNKDELLANQHGFIIAPGFGNRGIDGKLVAIKYAREHNIPCLGICLGMQTMAIEFAKNVLGYEKAGSTEFNPQTPHKIIDIMEEQKSISDKGGTMRIGSYPCHIKEKTLAYDIFKKQLIYERHRHRYEFNNLYKEEFEQNGMICSGVNIESNLVEIIELQNHRFFIGVQFHPEYSSTVLHPHPLFIKFIEKSISK